MPAYAQAKEMSHPSGSRILMAYSTEEEREIQDQFQAFREEQAEAHQAALEGREIKPRSHTLTLPKKV